MNKKHINNELPEDILIELENDEEINGKITDINTVLENIKYLKLIDTIMQMDEEGEDEEEKAKIIEFKRKLDKELP